ncbi:MULTISPECIES: hypothetical protein [unclassified Blastococcus]|nr:MULTISPECIES: hypothetical protein [unclassified Blastococcus]
MADELQHARDTHEPSDEARGDSSSDAAARAVARLLANPRRTRRA